MFKKMISKSNNCKVCYVDLSEEQKSIGLCDKCAEIEISKIKRRIVISPIIGVLLVFGVLFIIDYISTAAVPFEVNGVVKFMRIPVFSANINISKYFFYRISTMSSETKVFIGAVCFFLPFASYVHLDSGSHRHKSEMDLYRLDPVVGQKFGSKNPYRVEGVGFFVISIVISLVSGPFFLVYRIYKLRQLSRYVAEAERTY